MARILVIDDDPAVRAAMQMVLEREGLEVRAVGDGPSGIKLVAAEDFDLLLVDLFMPGMDGLETIRQVHRHKPGLPIVIMSGLSFASGTAAQPPDFLAMAGKLGAVGNLKKPFRPRELLAVVAQGLETSGGGCRAATG
jgi:CheY-like chemotaxis protein